MINKIYNILPQFCKDLTVEINRDLRLLWFMFVKPKGTKKCQDKSFLAYQKSRKYGPLKHICYAPYTSMFFARNGKVSPCYASYNDNSSSIDNASIHDIWFKGSFAKIREEHNNCDFETTCQFCNKLMLQKSYGSLLINKYEHYAFSKSKYPTIMEFELSNKCNLSCIMCDSNLSSSIEKNKKDDITDNKHYDKSFIEQLDEFIPHLQLAEFTGGDPFMIKEYYEIWDKIAKINPKCHILITTNANTMNPKIEHLLNTHKNIHFNVSIDSLEKENYENIRRGGKFEYALHNIDIFIDYCRKNKTNLNILVCPMTVNRHESHKFVEFANSKNICVYYHTVIKPKELSLKYLDKQLLQETISNLQTFEAPKITKKQKTNFENYQNLVKLLINWEKEDKKEESTNKKEELLTKTQALELILSKIDGNSNLNKKLMALLDELNKTDVYLTIIGKLVKIENNIFVEYLQTKTVEELKEICLNLK